MAKIFRSFLPAIIWALIILYFSTRGGVNLPSKIFDLFKVDKVGHFTFYLIFAALLISSFKFYFEKKWQIVAIGLIIAASYGILMEFIQFNFFPNRYFEYLDIVANISGSLSSLLFIRYLLK